MFFRKAQIEEGARRQYVREINGLLNAGQSAQAFAKTRELEKQDKDAAGYFMGYFYFTGENVKENPGEALRRLEAYVRRVPDDGDGYELLGNVAMCMENYSKAEDAYGKAIQLGNRTAIPLLADIYKLCADSARQGAAGTLNVREYAANNESAVACYINAMILYNKAAQTDSSLLSEAEWQGYGRAADMMYALSLNGEVKKINARSIANGGILALGASVTDGRKDAVTQGYWRSNAVCVTAQMEQAGYAAMAEYFRASFCLADCGKKKTELMSNAKWHMDRAGELSRGLSDAQREGYAEDFDDFIQEYSKQLRRNEREMQKRLRSGEMPNLGLDYPAGQVPAVDSCKTFMSYAASLTGGVPQSKAPEQPKKKKGLFGLF